MRVVSTTIGLSAMAKPRVIGGHGDDAFDRCGASVGGKLTVDGEAAPTTSPSPERGRPHPLYQPAPAG